jgi:hypothetical protein
VKEIINKEITTQEDMKAVHTGHTINIDHMASQATLQPGKMITYHLMLQGQISIMKDRRDQILKITLKAIHSLKKEH